MDKLDFKNAWEAGVKENSKLFLEDDPNPVTFDDWFFQNMVESNENSYVSRRGMIKKCLVENGKYYAPIWDIPDRDQEIEVVEVAQFTFKGAEYHSFDYLKKQLGTIKVTPDSRPGMARFWYLPNEEGRPIIWKSKPDSSD